MDDNLIVLISILAPVLSGLIAYFAAVKKANINLEIVKENNQKEFERMERAHQLELEKMQAQLDAEQKRAEYEIGMDIVKDIFKDPQLQNEMKRQALSGKKK